ncbi:barstar family protein [Pseudonocardia sp. TRM90224]|uniref:barstar family protein n=1 Tax=Pseudonocardia sp. TRM90224 TaxID=2812678 RepID=UPI001E39C27F|nr:barstar family protein [Pseudonocardia sp. TRM90224]
MRAGVERVERPAAEVAAAARRGGATVGVLPAVADRRSLFTKVGAALQFPGYYGRNLDALEECVRDLSWLPAGEVVLVWEDDAALLAADPATHRAVLEILTDAAAESKSGPRPLRVLLAPPAP